MIFETTSDIIETYINVAQIEITGRCNLNCKHCRGIGSNNLNVDMPLNKIKEIIDFAKRNSENNFLEIVLSGGEPLLHPEIKDILEYCNYKDVLIEITTNGICVNDYLIQLFKKNNISTISVSLDSTNEIVHNSIRGNASAYKKAMDAIKLLKRNDIRTRIRTTVSKSNFDEMEDMVLLAKRLSVDSIAFGPIIPVGNAVNLKDELFNTPDEMKQFIDEFYRLRDKYKNIMPVVTNECLHGLHDISEYNTDDNSSRIIDGCSAGIVSFNVLINGDITPCSMYQRKIFNIYKCDNYDYEYTHSSTINELLERNYLGKCGNCHIKYLCGGCRARAEFYTGNRLESDPLCWL